MQCIIELEETHLEKLPKCDAPHTIPYECEIVAYLSSRDDLRLFKTIEVKI